jgi:hypothetical protein
MHDAVEDGVGQGRIVEVGVPMFDRKRPGDTVLTRDFNAAWSWATAD